MVAICEAISDPATRFGFGTESSSSFIEFVVGLCGKFYPLFTATSVVCDWVIARESHLTEVQRNERKQMAAQLAEKILLEKLTLRALVNLSLANVFSGDYLLRKMQTAMEDGWPAVDQVTYCLKFRCSRLIELEFENCFV